MWVGTEGGGRGQQTSKQTDGVLNCDKSGNVVTQLIAASPTWHKKIHLWLWKVQILKERKLVLMRQKGSSMQKLMLN